MLHSPSPLEYTLSVFINQAHSIHKRKGATIRIHKRYGIRDQYSRSVEGIYTHVPKFFYEKVMHIDSGGVT